MLAALTARLTALGRRVRADERGASLVEYALLVALIAIVCFGALVFFGEGTGGSLDRSNDCLEAAYDRTAKPDHCPD